MFLLTTSPVLIIAAIIPAIVLMVIIYKADKLEKEPPSLLVSLFFFGIISTVIASFLERAGDFILCIFFYENSVEYNILFYFIVVAGAEEGAKYFLLKRRTWNSPYFNAQFDGVVYAVFVSLGFALWENIQYVLHYGFETALLRAVTAVPGHACFGVFMGIWYAFAKKYDNIGDAQKSSFNRKLAFIIPAAMHGTYDFLTTLDSKFDWIFVVFVIAMFITSIVMVRKISKNDRYI